MKRCKTCVFWAQNFRKDWQGACSNPNFVYTGDGAAVPENGLGYWDQESYEARFETGRDFGCIHYSNRGKK